jgi:hypothetical protein
MGKDYGSEWHFLEYRRRAAETLDADVLVQLGLRSPSVVEWVYPAEGGASGREPQGLGFLSESDDPRETKARTAWRDFWPQRGSQPCWDGVAKLDVEGQPTTWLLFEAKANHREFVGAPCKASPASRDKIERALGLAKRRLGVHRHFDWTGSYYQHANRLAVLAFLEKHRVQAKLVEVFFVGDRFPDGRECPATAAAWQPLLEARRLTLGLPPTESDSLVTHVFLPVRR